MLTIEQLGIQHLPAKERIDLAKEIIARVKAEKPTAEQLGSIRSMEQTITVIELNWLETPPLQSAAE